MLSRSFSYDKGENKVKIESNIFVDFNLVSVGQLSNATMGKGRLFKVRLDKFLDKNLEEKKQDFF